jgi:hypothetical protein
VQDPSGKLEAIRVLIDTASPHLIGSDVATHSKKCMKLFELFSTADFPLTHLLLISTPTHT